MGAWILRPEEVDQAFDALGFVCAPEVGTALFLAETLGKPLLRSVIFSEFSFIEQ